MVLKHWERFHPPSEGLAVTAVPLQALGTVRMSSGLAQCPCLLLCSASCLQPSPVLGPVLAGETLPSTAEPALGQAAPAWLSHRAAAPASLLPGSCRSPWPAAGTAGGTGCGCPCSQCRRPPCPQAQPLFLLQTLPGWVSVMKSLAPPGWLLAAGGFVPSESEPVAAVPGQRGPRPPSCPGRSPAAAADLAGRRQRRRNSPLCLAWECGAAPAAACHRCLSPPHKAAVLGEEQNLCPAPSRKVCAATQ